MAKILIAEDERDIRDLIAFTLKYAGHEVITTNDGVEAFEKTLSEVPDLVVMDIRMPRMSGFDACKNIKSTPEISHIPVIFLSAKGQEGEVKEGIAFGAEAYILKPFAPDHLNKIVEDILNA